MGTIDAHQHFWQFDPVRDAWITDDMAVLQRDFMPDDLAPLLQKNGIDGCVAVQADQSEGETHFLLSLAEQHAFIRGVVGWVDLCSDDLPERLEYFSGFQKLRGFRHILQGQAPGWMLQPAFLKGIIALKAKGFTYDILVFPRHLKAVHTLIGMNDQQPFIIDHLAKPYIKKGLIQQWAKDMRRIARFENVYCKISGMVTEANWQSWQPDHLWPYMETVLEAFGPQRVCYGSDWPVCLLAADYDRQLAVFQSWIEPLSPSERAALLGGNAAAFYQL